MLQPRGVVAPHEFGLEVAAKPLHAQGVGPPLHRALAKAEAVLVVELSRELSHREPPLPLRLQVYQLVLDVRGEDGARPAVNELPGHGHVDGGDVPLAQRQVLVDALDLLYVGQRGANL